MKKEEVNELGLYGIKKSFNKEIATSETKFYKGSIRSGQKMEFEGSLVILGDVNAGAEVLAEDNVVILGILRGMAHAGAKGNDSAYVIANSLCPKILQIADNIAEAPDDEYEESKNDKIIIPEIAFVSKDRIVIESFLPKTLKNKEIYRG